MNEQGGLDSFHNVLFAGCQAAVDASTNHFSIQAEQVTADVGAFWVSPSNPDSVGLTNSIILGTIGTASSYSAQDLATAASFQSNGAGNYYLAPGSPQRQAGTARLSPQLLAELPQKSTWPPLALPAGMTLPGSLTLLPTAARYAGGAPDLGYYYDALDYTVCNSTNLGVLTVLPGTAVAFRLDLPPDQYYVPNSQFYGLVLRENSSLVAHGLPTGQSSSPTSNRCRSSRNIPATPPSCRSSYPTTPTPRVPSWTFVSATSTSRWKDTWSPPD
jgi:hypothetical protein